jgi:hypothetical protein
MQSRGRRSVQEFAGRWILFHATLFAAPQSAGAALGLHLGSSWNGARFYRIGLGALPSVVPPRLASRSVGHAASSSRFYIVTQLLSAITPSLHHRPMSVANWRPSSCPGLGQSKRRRIRTLFLRRRTTAIVTGAIAPIRSVHRPAGIPQTSRAQTSSTETLHQLIVECSLRHPSPCSGRLASIQRPPGAPLFADFHAVLRQTRQIRQRHTT